MKIYDVVEDWKTKEHIIVELEVEEKPKTFVIQDVKTRGAYNYRKRILKDEVWFTPTEATDVKLATRKNWLESLEKRVKLAKEEIASLERLRKKLDINNDPI